MYQGPCAKPHVPRSLRMLSSESELRMELGLDYHPLCGGAGSPVMGNPASQHSSHGAGGAEVFLTAYPPSPASHTLGDACNSL